MKRGRLPLTALRSFEAAGRLESITLAAEELFVSQAAVSRQIRGLEDALGQALFERHHRAVRLTTVGRSLLGELTSCFDRMETALQGARVSGDLRAIVRVSVEPSFAAGRLLPALAAFHAAHPDIDVQIESDPRPIGFRGSDPSLAIRYSATKTEWPRVQARLLSPCEMVAVAAPALLARQRAPGISTDLTALPLVHEENRNLWRDWFARSGLDSHGVECGPIFDDGALVLQAAIQGQGAALVDSDMARDALRTGALVRLIETGFVHGAYFLLARDFDRLPDASARLAGWVMTHFGSA